MPKSIIFTIPLKENFPQFIHNVWKIKQKSVSKITNFMA